MEKVKRNERIGAILKTLVDAPNKIYTLSHFSEWFNAAKSTISEDVVILKNLFMQYDLGELETVTGAAGGVKYRPSYSRARQLAFMRGLCERLQSPERVLPGGYLYMGDILNNPPLVEKLGESLAYPFQKLEPDFVITVETQGIPVAMMTARALGVPMVICRRELKVVDGPVVTINYVSGQKRIQTMSLSRRAVSEGQRALIIDDFMKAGGTARGMVEMMKEFKISVVGIGVVVATQTPEKKLVDQYKALMTMRELDEHHRHVQLTPAPWLQASPQ